MFSVSLALVEFGDFSLSKSCKTYPGPMLPPGGRKWQLIKIFVNVNFA
jgi:hypothetical protein